MKSWSDGTKRFFIKRSCHSVTQCHFNVLILGYPEEEYPEEEDDRTMAVFVTVQEKLHKLPKYRQDTALIKWLKDSAFSCQRKAFINDFANVQTIADDYPFICNEEEVN